MHMYMYMLLGTHTSLCLKAIKGRGFLGDQTAVYEVMRALARGSRLWARILQYMYMLVCLVQLALIVHHMHHGACFTCYICPHIPRYMSALFSTCYLSVSTIQLIQYTKPTCTCFTPTHTCYLLVVT